MIFPIKPISQKRLGQILKGRNTAKYRDWRTAVLCRDQYKCQYPNCRNVDKLEIHHIKTFAKNSHIRTATFNGITLCASCHDKIQGREGAYEMTFFNIVKANTRDQKARDAAAKENKDNS
ncbi:MAG TPA: HNH endonuclease signature motif containing protein [Saprospiraceae bacterium]|nr:HNH endonuclease signature motif containing protein [Saprospiraceae bacterium]